MMATRTHTARPAVALALAGALAFGTTGCVDTSRSQSGGESVAECPWEGDDSVTGEVNIGWQRIPNGDLIVQDKGYLEACMPGVQITWTAYDSGADVVKAYAGGDVDLALIGNSPSTTAMSPPNNQDVEVVWIHDVIGQAESLIANDPSVTSLADLAGETVGVPFGSTAHYSLVQALAEDDLTSRVNLINLAPDAMPAAWRSGDVAAVWVWDPTQSALLETGGKRIMTSADTAEAGYPTFDLGTADAGFVDDNPEFMAQWAIAQDYATRMITDDPDQAAESIGAVLALPKADVLTQLEGYTYLDAAAQASPDYLGGKLAQDLVTTAQFLDDQDAVEGVLSDDEYADRVNPEPAQAAQGVN